LEILEFIVVDIVVAAAAAASLWVKKWSSFDCFKRLLGPGWGANPGYFDFVYFLIASLYRWTTPPPPKKVVLIWSLRVMFMCETLI
jgi:hypothetical protein